MKTERNEYLRVAAAVPAVRPADVGANLAAIRALLRQVAAARVQVAVFPELCLTGYTCADLFYQPYLLDAAERALAELIPDCGDGLVAVGLPVRVGGRIFNCAAVVAGRRLVGVVPKTYLPSTHEFYESRWFASALEATADEIELAGARVPFGNDLVFDRGDGAVVGVELCEDMWTANPPSTRLTLRGANVVLNLSGSNELVGKTEYRRSLVLGQSARCLAAYVYAGAGVGESTTDLVFGGHALVAENGALLAEGRRFMRTPQLTVADVDVGFLDFERSANFAFRSAARTVGEVRRVRVDAGRGVDGAEGALRRPVEPHPFVPNAQADRDARCEEILAIQSTGLATRLEAIRCRDVVIGLSGGLDSALALLVCVEAFDRLGLDRAGIHAFTLPGFGTTARTKGNAERLCAGLGVPLETIDIAPMARQHLKDLGRDEAIHDITYENTQARGRTYLLMDKANQLGGARNRDGRPVGAGSRMVYLQWRPHEHVRRQRRRPEDACAVHRGLVCARAPRGDGGRHRRAGSRPGRPGAPRHPRDAGLPRTAPGERGRLHRAGDGGQGGALRAARLLPLPLPAAGGGEGEDPPPGGGGVRGRLGRGDGRQVARHVLPALLRAAVQAQLPAGRPEGRQPQSLPARGLAHAKRLRFFRLLMTGGRSTIKAFEGLVRQDKLG